MLQDAEVENHHRADQHLEREDELPLGDEVRLAGLVDELADVEHRLVDRQPAELGELIDAEAEAEEADQQAPHQEGPAVGAAQEGDLAEIRQLQLCLAGEGRPGHDQRGQAHPPGKAPKTRASPGGA